MKQRIEGKTKTNEQLKGFCKALEQRIKDETFEEKMEARIVNYLNGKGRIANS